jgi:ABC-2 type transport system ATP-binding protein
VISVTRLTRRFETRTAVDDVSFDVGRGEMVALLGPNGAGKTTTLRMLAGLIGPTSGSVAIDGVTLDSRTAGSLRHRIGFLTESPGLWDRLTVRENLSVYARLFPLDDPDRVVGQLIDRFELAPYANARAAELSKGLRQKIAIGRALLHHPDVLLLDEPTSGLDPEVAMSVRQLLDERRAEGCAILLSTHNLHEAERQADRIAVLKQRLIVFDTPAQLRQGLRSARVAVRVTGSAMPYLATARHIDSGATADDAWLSLTLRQPDVETAALVRALVQAGASIEEVRPVVPTLEDVYLSLVGNQR